MLEAGGVRSSREAFVVPKLKVIENVERGYRT